MHGRPKCWRLIGRTLSVIVAGSVSWTGLQHWAGLYSFSCSFRRCLFSIGQDIYGLIAEMSTNPQEKRRTPAAVRDEVLLGGLSAGLAFQTSERR